MSDRTYWARWAVLAVLIMCNAAFIDFRFHTALKEAVEQCSENNLNLRRDVETLQDEVGGVAVAKMNKAHLDRLETDFIELRKSIRELVIEAQKLRTEIAENG